MLRCTSVHHANGLPAVNAIHHWTASIAAMCVKAAATTAGDVNQERPDQPAALEPEAQRQPDDGRGHQGPEVPVGVIQDGERSARRCPSFRANV